MGLWRDFLRLMGFSGDARVHISAPGIDVVITGEPDQVRSLLGVVKYELERSARWRDRRPHSIAHPQQHNEPRRTGNVPAPSALGGGVISAVRSSQFVQPTELDEMDSPYALPDPLVMPVEDTTGERERPTPMPSDPGADVVKFVAEAATLVPDVAETHEEASTGPSVRAVSRRDVRPPVAVREDTPVEVGATKIDGGEEPEHEREVTAISPNPSGPQSLAPPAIVRSSSPFVTDGGPTLTPSVSDSSEMVRKTDPDADETKETRRSSES